MLKDIYRHFKVNKKAYLLLFSIILFSDDSFWFSTSGISSLQLIKKIMMVMLPFLLFFQGAQFRDTKLIFIFTLSTIGTLASAFVHGNIASGGAMALCCAFLTSWLYVEIYSFKTFVHIFRNILVLLIGLSLIGQICVSIGIFTSSVENTANVVEQTSLGNIYVFSYGNMSLRNCGIFREPGVFMIYICLAYMFDILYINKSLSIKNMLIYVIGIITTISTAGIIIFALLTSVFIFDRKTLKLSKSTLLFIAVIVVGLVSNNVFYNAAFRKIERGGDSVSFFARMSSVTVPLEIIKENILFGCGNENYRYVYGQTSSRLYGDWLDAQGVATNTYLGGGAQWGIWMTIYFLLGLYAFSHKLYNYRNRNKAFVVFGAIIMMLSNETLVYTTIFHILVFYGLSTKVLTDGDLYKCINLNEKR